MDYVGSPKQPGCLFCRVLAAPASEDRANLLVHRDDGAIVMLNRFPYSSGHLMVAPAQHVGSLTDLDDEGTLAVMRLVRRSLRALERVAQPQGFNVGCNLGQAAGAGIPGHVHMHVVPRWDGDTSFMPVLAEVRVVNEHLQRTWEKLVAVFDDGSAQRP
jgi:ATP adenylyltransferase